LSRALPKEVDWQGHLSGGSPSLQLMDGPQMGDFGSGVTKN